MSIYHLSVKTISRNTGRSAVAAVAYRAGEDIKNEKDGFTHKYSGRKDVVYSVVLLPENAPEQWRQRSVLWNAVEQVEKRKDAQTAREVEVALPVEFSRELQQEVLKQFCQDNFVSQGMVADVNVHDKGDGNPHAHIMLTTRNIENQQFAKKNREWNDKARLQAWRENWAVVCNQYLEEQNKIDHRSFEDQGKEALPQIHEGYAARKRLKQGKTSERIEHNAKIREFNRKLPKLRELDRQREKTAEILKKWQNDTILRYISPRILETYALGDGFEDGNAQTLHFFASDTEMLSFLTLQEMGKYPQKMRRYSSKHKGVTSEKESYKSFEAWTVEEIKKYFTANPQINEIIMHAKHGQNADKMEEIGKEILSERGGIAIKIPFDLLESEELLKAEKSYCFEEYETLEEDEEEFEQISRGMRLSR